MDPNPTPKERIWTVPCFVVTETGEYLPDAQAVASAFFELQAILTRIGGVVQIGTKREPIPVPPGYPEQIATTVLVIRWQSFAPVVREDPATAYREEAPPSEPAPPAPPAEPQEA